MNVFVFKRHMLLKQLYLNLFYNMEGSEALFKLSRHPSDLASNVKFNHFFNLQLECGSRGFS